jgi:DNA anti-recombination protein RmuC
VKTQFTKEEILEQANQFWEKFGRFTFYETKEGYLKDVIGRYSKIKKMGKKRAANLLKQMQDNTLKDLKTREEQIEKYLGNIKNLTTKVEDLRKG